MSKPNCIILTEPMFHSLDIFNKKTDLFRCLSCRQILFCQSDVTEYLESEPNEFGELSQFGEYSKSSQVFRFFMFQKDSYISSLKIDKTSEQYFEYHPFFQMMGYNIRCSKCASLLGYHLKTGNLNTVWMVGRTIINVESIYCWSNNRNQMPQLLKRLGSQIKKVRKVVHRNRRNELSDIVLRQNSRGTKTEHKKSEVFLKNNCDRPFSFNNISTRNETNNVLSINERHDTNLNPTETLSFTHDHQSLAVQGFGEREKRKSETKLKGDNQTLVRPQIYSKTMSEQEKHLLDSQLKQMVLSLTEKVKHYPEGGLITKLLENLKTWKACFEHLENLERNQIESLQSLLTPLSLIVDESKNIPIRNV